MEKKWYLSTFIIAVCFALWQLAIPPIIGIVLLILQNKQNKENQETYNYFKHEYYNMLNKYNTVGAKELNTLEDVINKTNNCKNNLSKIQNELSLKQEELKQLKDNIANQDVIIEKNSKAIASQIKKIDKIKDLYKAIDYSLNKYAVSEFPTKEILLSDEQEELINEISPNIILKLHYMNAKDLNKAYRENDKKINNILAQYETRYTSKTNQTIYKLMVLALRAELQNTLYNLKYQKLDNSIDDIVNITQKYLAIAKDGNQAITSTLTKFIGEIEYLFINAVKIEYNYYVKKEQAKQEQAAIREQIRQEQAERKALADERAKVEAEEKKYNNELERLNTKIEESTSDKEIAELKMQISKLQSQLSDVVIKKDEIINLQHGKAGNIYIISNLGSFGENVFKIGMTRRIDPQERINELGNASVPFRFDVHSFIFSEDAVSLEKQLHDRLNSKRVNKVNLRKEFFNVSINELKELVDEIAPQAEFNETMLAEEYKQSLSTDEIYENSYAL